LSGQYGRARSLVLRPELRADPATAALAAEVLRRAGDLALAEATAGDAIRSGAGADAVSRARAVLARIAFDRGDLAAAEELCAVGANDADAVLCSALCEVAALCAAARGDTVRALAEVARGEALATTAEERARMAGFRGYVGHSADPGATHAAYAAA